MMEKMQGVSKRLAAVGLGLIFLGGVFLGTLPERLAASADGTVVTDYSVEDVTVTSGGNTYTGRTDPYYNTDISASGQLTGNTTTLDTVSASETIIYTARWLYTTTHRTGVTEYTVEPDGNTYRITTISQSGNSYIPVGGFVVSLASGSALGEVGDAVTLGGTEFELASMAVESDDGDRVAVDALNATRSEPMVVYYDYQTGDKTGTNAYGTEMIAVYDESANRFIVTAFRDFGTGDDAGSDIPENGFVLSAYGEGYRGILAQDHRFSLGDQLTMVGFDYIRFGNTLTHEYDYIDPTLEDNPSGWDSATNAAFPAYRGENQMIVYRDGWSWEGSSGTGTNAYGFEVAVDADGIVVERAVNVTAIPEGGFVLSGHGTERDYLRSNVPLGATVTINESNNTFSVTTTLNSFYTNVETTLNSAIEDALTSIEQLYDVDADTINALIDSAQTALAELKTLKEEIEANTDWSDAERMSHLMEFNSLQLEVENTAYLIIAASMESSPVQGRAVWHRPTEHSLAEIRASLETYKECGFNLIFVEAFYGGMSLFKSDYMPYHSDFASDSFGDYPDYLTAFAAIANEVGIEVHAWVEDFYVGLNPDAGIAADHADWLLYNDDGTIYQRNEGGAYVFLDPANEEVQDLLIDFYNELLDEVPYISGLNLDYIRYPVSSREEDTGYTLAAMTGFAETLGVTLDTSSREAAADDFSRLFNSDYTLTADENYDAWVDYRTQIITDFVERIKDEVKGTHEGLILSTAVFPSLTESINTKMQDWQTWFSNGWIDVATPMAYYTDSADVLTHVSDMILMAGNNCYYYAGLASSYSGLPAYENANQIDAALLGGSHGYVIFCSTQVLGHEDVQEVLKSGINAADAVLPHASVAEVLEAYFDCILDRAERIYIPAGGMTQEQYTALETRFEEILAMDVSTSEGINEVLLAIGELADDYRDYATGYSARRLSGTLSEVESMIDRKLSRFMIDNGEWDPETTPVRPTAGETDPDTDGTDPGETDTQTPSGGCANGCSGAVSLGTGTGVAVLVVAAAVLLAVFVRRGSKKSRKSGDRKGSDGTNSVE